jgi:hypothetical protein
LRDFLFARGEAVGLEQQWRDERWVGLLRWVLDHGLRIVQQSTLMTMGLYNEPAGAYLPSIRF